MWLILRFEFRHFLCIIAEYVNNLKREHPLPSNSSFMTWGNIMTFAFLVKLTQNALTVFFRVASSSCSTLDCFKCKLTMCWHLGAIRWSYWLVIISGFCVVPVVVSDELVLLSGRVGRCWGVPPVLRNVGVRFNEHTELQIFSLVHLDWKTLVGQFRGQLWQQPDVGLVCLEEESTTVCFRCLINIPCFSMWDVARGFYVAYLQPAGTWLNCSPLLH